MRSVADILAVWAEHAGESLAGDFCISAATPGLTIEERAQVYALLSPDLRVAACRNLVTGLGRDVNAMQDAIDRMTSEGDDDGDE